METTTSRICSIKKVENNSKRYDIEIESNNNFFANNVLVHNCQVLQPLLDKYKDTKCYYTEKLDGSSLTAYYMKEFGVCSRNVDLRKDKDDRFWRTALEHDLENKFKYYFKDKYIAMQGELIGIGVQGNKYQLTNNDIYFFNVFFIKEHRYGNLEELEEICNMLGEKTVPVLDRNYILTNDIPSLVELSKGYSVLNKKTLREGIVIRPYNEIYDTDFRDKLVANRVSFKSVNPEFLLKYGE